MQQWDLFRKPKGINEVIDSINIKCKRPIKIMEICGTHTMAIAKAGLKNLLNPDIQLISGPGCPVCVTSQDRIDSIIKLAENKNIIIATYGDMLRVPGSQASRSLLHSKAMGADVEIVYSSIDAINIAKANPNKEVVFLGIGFETTTPSSAVAVKCVVEENIKNFSLFSMHKLCEPVLRTIIAQDDFDIDGFLCPGNVSVIIGESGFEFLSKEYNVPAVICGFEGGDIVTSLFKLTEMINNNSPKLINEYMRLVSRDGNVIAKTIIDEYFEVYDDLWRGIGLVKNSGLRLKQDYRQLDAVYRFGLSLRDTNDKTVCKCGEVIMGKLDPGLCNLFAKTCTPDNPIGPCMVSSEGACAARFKYGLWGEK